MDINCPYSGKVGDILVILMYGGLLNYGYSILRSTTARAVVSVGLHPTLGIHHKNEGNPMRLVDDLMEPYRPIVDLKVWALL